MLNAIMNGEFNAKAQQVAISYGLKSTGWNVRLQMLIYNHRTETVHFGGWTISTNQYSMDSYDLGYHLTADINFGTHPWLITTPNGDMITSIIPVASNLELTIE